MGSSPTSHPEHPPQVPGYTLHVTDDGVVRGISAPTSSPLAPTGWFLHELGGAAERGTSAPGDEFRWVAPWIDLLRRIGTVIVAVVPPSTLLPPQTRTCSMASSREYRARFSPHRNMTAGVRHCTPRFAAAVAAEALVAASPPSRSTDTTRGRAARRTAGARPSERVRGCPSQAHYERAPRCLWAASSGSATWPSPNAFSYPACRRAAGLAQTAATAGAWPRLRSRFRLRGLRTRSPTALCSSAAGHGPGAGVGPGTTEVSCAAPHCRASMVIMSAGQSNELRSASASPAAFVR